MENEQKLAGEAQTSQKKPFYKRWWFITIAVIVVLSAIFGSSDEKKDEGRNEQETQTQQSQTPVAEKAEEPVVATVAQTQKEEVKIPKYEIIYELKNKRYDGGVNYFALIDPVNLSNDNFINDVKNIINEIVKAKGSKISIDIVDDKPTLDLEYKSHYGSNTLGRILNKSETDQIGLHLIATFDGEMQTGIYPNSLMFFPATFKDNPKVGKYIETIEFKPSK